MSVVLKIVVAMFLSQNAIQDHFEFMMEEESIWLYGTVLLCLTVLLLVFFGVHWFEKSSKCSSSNRYFLMLKEVQSIIVHIKYIF